MPGYLPSVFLRGAATSLALLRTSGLYLRLRIYNARLGNSRRRTTIPSLASLLGEALGEKPAGFLLRRGRAVPRSEPEGGPRRWGGGGRAATRAALRRVAPPRGKLPCLPLCALTLPPRPQNTCLRVSAGWPPFLLGCESAPYSSRSSLVLRIFGSCALIQKVCRDTFLLYVILVDALLFREGDTSQVPRGLSAGVGNRGQGCGRQGPGAPGPGLG